jgi:hypothetical protein
LVTNSNSIDYNFFIKVEKALDLQINDLLTLLPTSNFIDYSSTPLILNYNQSFEQADSP